MQQLVARLLVGMQLPQLLTSTLSRMAAPQAPAATGGVAPGPSSCPCNEQLQQPRSPSAVPQSPAAAAAAVAVAGYLYNPGHTALVTMAICTCCDRLLVALSCGITKATAPRILSALATSKLLDRLLPALAQAASGVQHMAAADAAPATELLKHAIGSLDDTLQRLLTAVAHALPGICALGGMQVDADGTALSGAPDPLSITPLQRMALGTWSNPLVRRVLAAPGLQYWVAARMVQALRAADGGPSWGMPEVSLPLPDVRKWAPSGPRARDEERAVAFMHIAVHVLSAGVAEHVRRPHSSGAAESDAAGSPIQPGDIYSIAMRALEWAMPGANGAAVQADQRGAHAGAAQQGPAVAPEQLPLWRLRASPYALLVAHHAVPLALAAALARPLESVEQRLLAVVPFAASLLAGACDEDAPNSALVSQARVAMVAAEALHDVVKEISRRFRTSGLAAAAASGVAPALQAAVAWLTPEREQQLQRHPADFDVKLFHCYLCAALGVCLEPWSASAAPATRTQVAALAASLRSAFMCSWLAADGQGSRAMPHHSAGCLPAACTLGGWMGDLLQECRAALLPSLQLQLTLYLFAQWAPLVCRMGTWVLAADCHTHRVTAAIKDELYRSGLSYIGVAAHACNLLRIAAAAAAKQQQGVGSAGSGSTAARCNGAGGSGSSSGSSAPAQGHAASAEIAAALASWRCFLLRDLRALDVQGFMLQAAAALRAEIVELLLDTLQALCCALPHDVQRHLEAGQQQQPLQPPLSLQLAAQQYVAAEQAVRCTATQAASCGLAWLRLDAPTRALLGPARFNRPELLAFLEVMSGSQAAGPKPGSKEARNAAAALQQAPFHSANYTQWFCAIAAALPPPRTAAALLATCDNPACAAQACYLAVGRGGPLPALCACPKCGRARYCSKGCRKAHWDAYHKAECGQGWWDAGSGC